MELPFYMWDFVERLRSPFFACCILLKGGRRAPRGEPLFLHVVFCGKVMDSRARSSQALPDHHAQALGLAPGVTRYGSLALASPPRACCVCLIK